MIKHNTSVYMLMYTVQSSLFAGIVIDSQSVINYTGPHGVSFDASLEKKSSRTCSE